MAAEGRNGIIGLALSGGAARTLAHVGALKVLQRERLPIAALAGTSGGALVAALIAAGYPLADLERQARTIGWRRIVDFRPAPLGVMSTEGLGRFMRQTIGEPRFEDLRLPCAAVAADLTALDKRVFRSGPVVPAVEASCAIPEFFRPVVIDGHTYVDGGLVEPLPVETLVEMSIDHPCVIVAINVLQRTPDPGPIRHIGHLVGRISQIVQHRLICQSVGSADVLVEPDVGDSPFFDLENAADLIAAGEVAMEQSLPRLWTAIERWERNERGAAGS